MNEYEDLLKQFPSAEGAAAAPLCFRELHEPAELVCLLRLRHRVYFEQCGYGPLKPLGLDLTSYDARSRLFGVFAGAQLVGGVRFVFRSLQHNAAVMRAVHAVVSGSIEEQTEDLLPSEEAFDLTAALGSLRQLVDLEAGRLVVLRAGVARGLMRELMIAALAVAHLARCRLYLYSCSVEMRDRYARVTRPRWQLTPCSSTGGILSDGFAFPRPSVAAVAAIEDSPLFGRALEYARELRKNGSITLRPESAFFGERV